MLETRNNCFESKKRNMILRQAKAGKHEDRNTTATQKIKFDLEHSVGLEVLGTMSRNFLLVNS